jgi:hypothetical protein
LMVTLSFLMKNSKKKMDICIHLQVSEVMLRSFTSEL